jgi:hypothetical protein
VYVLNVHNVRDTQRWNWYGEGDDMIFIDGEEWQPSLHGTGTEDYFNTAWRAACIVSRSPPTSITTRGSAVKLWYQAG